MENHIQDKGRLHSILEKYPVKSEDAIFKSIVVICVWFNFSDEIIDKIFSSTSDANELFAKVFAILIDIDKFEEVTQISDIKRINERNNDEIIENFYNSKFKELYEQVDIVKEDLHSIKEFTSSFKLPNIEDFDSKNIVTSLDGVKDHLGSLDDTVNERLKTIDVGISKCFSSLLELTDSIISFIKKLESNESYDRLLQEQKKMLEEYFCSLHPEEILDSYFEKKGFLDILFGRNKKNKDVVLPISEEDIKEEIETQPKNEEVVIDSTLQNYEEVYSRVKARLEKGNDKDLINGIIELIQTGVFDDEQVKVLKSAIKSKLSISDILLLANPSINSKTMAQTVDFYSLKKEDNIEKKEVPFKDNKLPLSGMRGGSRNNFNEKEE